MFDEVTNETRALWAQNALIEFQCQTATEDDDVVCDFLADLLHYCSANDTNFEVELSRARMHYEAELEEER